MVNIGAHLHTALGGNIDIVGVAMRPFAGAVTTIPVLRGMSQPPLFVTVTSDDVAAVARPVRAMHGDDRIPTLLKRVDRLARDA